MFLDKYVRKGFVWVFLFLLFALQDGLFCEDRHESNVARYVILVKDLPAKAEYVRYVRALSMPQRKLEAVDFLKWHSVVAQKELIEFLSSRNAKEIKSFWLGNMIRCELDSEEIYQIKKRDDVIGFFEDKKVKMINDVLFGKFEPLADTAWGVKKIGAPSVWTSGYRGRGVIVGCLDSGIRYTHRDIMNRMWINLGEIPSNGRDDDGNGYIDDYYGYDFVNGDGDPMDDNTGIYHGTHTAGTVAGDGTSGTYTGVAPEAQVMALKVIDASGSGYPSDILDAIQYGVEMGAMTFNMSLGFAMSSDAVRDAFRAFFEDLLTTGLTIAISAGNGNEMGGHYSVPYDIATPADCPPPWYGSGGNTAVIAVGATNTSDNIASFSSYGPTRWNDSRYNDYPYPPGLIKPDIVAPGVGIVSLNGATTTGYYSADGTSMASPHVAGVIALMLSKNSDLSPEMIDSILEVTALDRGSSGRDNYYGAGRVRASLAVAATPEVTVPNIKYYNSAVDPSPGDGVFNPGETVNIVVHLKNFGADASNVYATLSESSPFVSIVDNSSSYGSILRGLTSSNSSDPFRVSSLITTPRGHKVWFYLNITASGGYSSRDSFAVVVGAYPRTYADLNAGNFIFTITNFGYCGYFDPTANTPQGSGFRYPRTETSSYMFGGEFLLGISYDNVITGEYGVSSEWLPTSSITNLVPGTFADQELRFSFVDPGSLIEVNAVAYAWADELKNDFAILEFKLVNRGTTSFTNIYTGYYIDWDIDYDSATRTWYDKGAYVGSNIWAYMYDSKVPPSLPAYVGLVGLTSGARGSMVDNAIHVYPDSMGWADSVKYNFMIGRFNISNASVAKDWSMIIANGPFNIAPNDSFKVAYAVVAGNTLSDFQSNAAQARITYGMMTSVEKKTHPDDFLVSLPYPNPFNSSVMVDIDAKRGAQVLATICDILGKVVYRKLINLDDNRTRFIWVGKGSDGSELPSGIYLMNFESENKLIRRKVILMK